MPSRQRPGAVATAVFEAASATPAEGSPSATSAAAMSVPKKIMADWINSFIWTLPRGLAPGLFQLSLRSEKVLRGQ